MAYWQDQKYRSDEVFKKINKNFLTLTDEDIKEYNVHLEGVCIVQIFLLLFFQILFNKIHPYLIHVLCVQ